MPNLGLLPSNHCPESQKWLKNLTRIDFRLNPLPANSLSANQQAVSNEEPQLFWWRSVKDQVYEISVTDRIREKALIAIALG